MNFWKWILFYIYSGVAFLGLVASMGHTLVPQESLDPGTDDERLLAESRAKIIKTALELGDAMADSTSMSIIQGHNQMVADHAIRNHVQQQALAAATPINQMGA